MLRNFHIIHHVDSIDGDDADIKEEEFVLAFFSASIRFFISHPKTFLYR